MTFTWATASSDGVITDVPPHAALTVLIPSIEMPLCWYPIPPDTACGPFSVAKIPEFTPGAEPGLPGPWEPGNWLPPPPDPCELSPVIPGASCASINTLRPADGRVEISLLLMVPLTVAVSVSSASVVEVTVT